MGVAGGWDAGMSGAGAVPLRLVQMMGQHKKIFLKRVNSMTYGDCLSSFDNQTAVKFESGFLFTGRVLKLPCPYANVLATEIHENTGCTRTGSNSANVLEIEIHENIGCSKTGFNSANVLEIEIRENTGCTKTGFNSANVLKIEIHENTGCSKTGFNSANVLEIEIHENTGCTETGFNSAVLNTCMKAVILLHSYKAKEDKTG